MSNYSPKITEHFMNPRNCGELADANVKVIVGNPVCGDQIHLFVHADKNKILNCSFLAYGCVASIATASILTEEIVGKSFDELSTFTESEIENLVGGLTPQQHHCAVIGEELMQKLMSASNESVK